MGALLTWIDVDGCRAQVATETADALRLTVLEFDGAWRRASALVTRDQARDLGNVLHVWAEDES